MLIFFYFFFLIINVRKRRRSYAHADAPDCWYIYLLVIRLYQYLFLAHRIQVWAPQEFNIARNGHCKSGFCLARCNIVGYLIGLLLFCLTIIIILLILLLLL